MKIKLEEIHCSCFSLHSSLFFYWASYYTMIAYNLIDTLAVDRDSHYAVGQCRQYLYVQYSGVGMGYQLDVGENKTRKVYKYWISTF